MATGPHPAAHPPEQKNYLKGTNPPNRAGREREGFCVIYSGKYQVLETSAVRVLDIAANTFPPSRERLRISRRTLLRESARRLAFYAPVFFWAPGFDLCVGAPAGFPGGHESVDARAQCECVCCLRTAGNPGGGERDRAHRLP